MAPNGSRIPIRLEQLTSKHTPNDGTRKPLSDIELVELYHAVNIWVRIARVVAMPDPNLQHLVVLCNLCDAISVGEYRQYLERIRARSWPIRSGASARPNHNAESVIPDTRSVTPTQCDASEQFRLENIHLNF